MAVKLSRREFLKVAGVATTGVALSACGSKPTIKKSAGVVDFKDAPFSAVGDGTTDDRAAFVHALSTLKSGDVLFIPSGNYRIVLTQEPLTIPAGITLLGQNGKSTFSLSSSGGPGEYREFLRFNSGVTLEGLAIERDGDFPAVLLPIFGDASNVTLRNCSIVGNVARFPDAYCHAIQVGVGKLEELLLDGIEIMDCVYGLFQSNEATGSVEGVTIENSHFQQNSASDLEFNSPKGQMRNILVRDCYFSDNLCTSDSGGFAVGFANVTDGRVVDCHIQNYPSEALHVEDRSTNIHLVGNTIVGGSTIQPNGVIMVLSNSKQVMIERNFVDARPNTNGPYLILVTAGGKQVTSPSDVLVNDNVLVNGPSTKMWYLEDGSGPPPSGNLVLP